MSIGADTDLSGFRGRISFDLGLLFRMYDTDGKGGIDFTEFMILFHIMDDGTPEQV